MLPAEDRLQPEPRWWQPGENHATLGLRWYPLEDEFAYATKLEPLEQVTKRTVLSLTAKLFDPLGWLAPVTVRAKISFQSTWLLGLSWDDPLPDDDARHWRAFRAEIPQLERIRVPRWLGEDLSAGASELHGFADASERAYATCELTRPMEQ